MAEASEEMTAFLLKLTQLSFETMKDFQQYTKKNYIPKDTDLKAFVFEVCDLIKFVREIIGLSVLCRGF